MNYSEEHEAYIREHCDIRPDEDYEMDLTVKDRKKLWLSTGNKCALCKCILHQKKSKTNIGEECHISSERPDHPSKEFPRYDPGFDQRNTSVDNAIILCANCHKIIDNPENTQYTIEELHRIKERHEVEVEKNPDVIKERDERRKQLQEWIQEHNQTLMNNFIKPWSESTSVDESNLLAIEHLQSGYKDIWDLRPNKPLLRCISDDRKIIKEELLNKFGGIPVDFEWKHNSGVTKIPVYRILNYFFQNDDLSENCNINTEDFIESIIKDEPLYEKIKKIDKNEEIRDDKTNEFENGLMEIVQDFEEKHIPLKGTCKICKEWHNELQDENRDKERIYNWLYNKTEAYKWITVGGYIDGGVTGTLTDTRWRSTEEIASAINLTVERTEKLCFQNEKLKKMTKEDIPNEKKNTDERDLKRWAIKEFVSKYRD